MNWIQEIWADIKSGENLDIYITIPLAVVVAIWGILGLPQTTTPIVSAATLGALAVVLGGILQNRKSNHDLQALIANLREAQTGEIKGSDYLRSRNEYASLSDSVATAKHIYFMAPTLVNIFAQWHSYLHDEKLNKDGAVIQAIFFDPDSASIESAAKCVREPADNVRRDVERGLSYIKLIIDKGVKNGSIEARTNVVFANFSMVLIDPDEAHARIFVEFKGYGKPFHSRPHIELTRKRDGEWYEHFLDQYNLMWRDSQPKYNSQNSSQ